MRHDRSFLLLFAISSLLVVACRVASAQQQSACITLPAQTPAAGTPARDNNRAAIAVAAANSDLAAQQKVHQDAVAKALADPAMQAKIAAARQQFAAAANDPEFKKKQADMQQQLAALQNSDTFKQLRAAFPNICQPK
jgi:hypothetical protein